MKRKAYLLILLFVPLYFSCKKAYHKDWKFQVCSSIARSDQQPALDRLHDFKGEPKRATDSIFGTYLSETTVNDTVVNEYLFSKGQIKRVNTLIEGSEMSMRMEYDGNGNIKALESNPDGSKSEFTYDDAGRPASHSYSLAQGKTEKTRYQYFEGNDSLYIFHEGRGTEKIYLTETDTVMAVVRDFESEGLLLSRKMEFYDKKSRLVQTHYFRQDKLYLRTKYVFDNQGNVIFRLSEREAAAESERLLAERGSSYRYEYNYDPQGNWIQKISRQLDGNWTSTETRKIEY